MRDFLETTGNGLMILFAIAGTIVVPTWILIAVLGVEVFDLIVSVLSIIAASWIVGTIVGGVNE